MIPRTWRNWLKAWFSSVQVTGKSRRKKIHLQLEPLENRWVPSTFTYNVNDPTGADIAGTTTPTGGNTFSATSLRAALTAANGIGAGNTAIINLPGQLNHYLVSSGSGGTLDINNANFDPVTIQTSGSGTAIIDGQKNTGNATSLFEVEIGNTLNVINLEFLNGQAITPGGAGQGGAINNCFATLNVQKCVFIGNEADGHAVNGGSSSTGSSWTGGTGQGGAIYNQGGNLSIADSTFNGNIARGGSVTYGRLTGPSGPSLTLTGGEGLGGAVYLTATGGSAVKITGSTFADNEAIGGDATHNEYGGTGGEAIFGGFAAGGALFREAGSQGLTIANCTFAKTATGSGNIAQGGNAHDNTRNTSHDYGGGAEGGGLALDMASTEIINLTHDTIAYNSALSGTPTSPGPTGGLGAAAGNAEGGGIYVDVAPTTGPQMLNTLVALNTAASGTDVFGPFNGSGHTGHNLINKYDSTVASGFSSGEGDILGDKNAGLLNLNLDTSLKNNGGPTFTVALLTSSIAIDAGDNYSVTTGPPAVGPLSFDQRGAGFARLVGPHVDIGAFEVQPPPPPKKGRCSFPH